MPPLIRHRLHHTLRLILLWRPELAIRAISLLNIGNGRTVRPFAQNSPHNRLQSQVHSTLRTAFRRGQSLGTTSDIGAGSEDGVRFPSRPPSYRMIRAFEQPQAIERGSAASMRDLVRKQPPAYFLCLETYWMRKPIAPISFACLLDSLSPSVTDVLTWWRETVDMPNVPDFSGFSSADTAPTIGILSEGSNVSEANATRKRRQFGNPTALLNVTLPTPKVPMGQTAAGGIASEEGNKQEQSTTPLLRERQTCASGSAFYVCQNGFRGCCSVNPCNTGGACPDGQATEAGTATPASAIETATTTAQASSTEASLATLAVSLTGKISTAISSTTTAVVAALPTGKTSSSATTFPTPLANPPPACPAGNGTTFTDSSKLDYVVHCNADNTASSNNAISVGMGGYGECFSACSISSCAGFTFVGLDDGDCYLKASLPNNTYVAKEGSNYITCAKVDPGAVAAPISAQQPAKDSSKAGTIAGGIVGGFAFLGLLLLLIALLARRRRKKIEEKRATITHNVLGGPFEPQRTDFAAANTQSSAGGGASESLLPMHQRQGSTANDVFAPYGGFYRGFSTVGASVYEKKATLSPTDAPPTPPGLKREGSGYVLIPGIYRHLEANRSADPVAMLDSTPIQRPVSQSSGPRSPRFHEHIAEMDDTSLPSPPSASTPLSAAHVDSPTLGRDSEVTALTSSSMVHDVRRRQHLMSWNNYDVGAAVGKAAVQEEIRGTVRPKTPPAQMQREREQISPDESGSPSDGKYVVSPFGSLDMGR